MQGDKYTVKMTRTTLRSIKLFANLSDAIADEVLAHNSIRARRYAAKERIVSRYDRDKHVYFIVSGRVAATLFTVGNHDREVTYDFLEAGDMFGELAALDGGSRTTDVEAEQDVVVAVMGSERFRELLRNYPAELGEPAMRHLTAMVRRLVQRVFDFSAYGVPERIRRYLLQLARKHSPTGNTAVIRDRITQTDIAAQVCTDRGAVSREFSQLAELGIATWGRCGRTAVHDIAGLEKLIHG